MSTRCRNDIFGCKSRLQSTLTKWRESLAAVEEAWRDETAIKFYNESIGEVDPSISRMMASLQEAGDLVRMLEKRVADEDRE